MTHSKQVHAFRAALLAVALLLCTDVQCAPLAVYGQLPNVENVALSPDGSRIAFVYAKGNLRRVVVQSVATHQTLGGVDSGEFKLRSIDWADDSRLMILTSVVDLPAPLLLARSEWFELTVYDVDKRTSVILPQQAGLHDGAWKSQLKTLRVVNKTWVRHPGGRTVVFISTDYSLNGNWEQMLVRVDLDTNSETILSKGSTSTRDWFIDAEGQLVGESRYYESEQRWSLLFRRDGRMTEIASAHEPIDPPKVLGLGPEPDTLLIVRIEDGDPVWRTMSTRDGSFSAARVGREPLDAPIEDHSTYRMIGGYHVDDDVRYVFFDTKMQSRWDAIVRAFPDERVSLSSYSIGFSKVVVRVNGARDGLVYELIDMSTMRATPIAQIYEGLGAPLEVRRVTYSAGDGMLIPAYVTLPTGRVPKSLPLIVMPHDGPGGRSSSDFDWWAQALAAQGYVVLQPNYRGSGLGWIHYSAGFGEWGRRMQTDLSDGVKYLASQGMIDPARVCIVGEGYGGYAALTGVALEPSVYRCAVSVAGESDMKRLLHWIDVTRLNRDQLRQRNIERFLGVTSQDDPKIDEVSPLRHAQTIRSPVLLIHGQDDTVIPFEQSKIMFDALRGAHKNVDLIELRNEDHLLSSGASRLQMLQASVAFLRVNNPPE